jgi:hypothetical protein
LETHIPHPKNFKNSYSIKFIWAAIKSMKKLLMGLMAHGSLVASRNMQALKREINVHLHKGGLGIR